MTNELKLMSVKDTTGKSHQVWMTDLKYAEMTELANVQKGTFAYFGGYRTQDVSASKNATRLMAETSNVVIRTGVDNSRIYEQIVFFLQNLNVEDINLDNLFHTEPFNIPERVGNEIVWTERKAEKKEEPSDEVKNAEAIIAIKEMIASHQKTLDGKRDDAYRQGHDRCHLVFAPGKKFSFLTEPQMVSVEGEDKPVRRMMPVLKEGHPIAKDIRVEGILQGKKVTSKGVYKYVNSRIRTRIKNRIEQMFPKELNIKFYSIKDDNFEVLSMGGRKIRPEDVEAKSFTWDELVEEFGFTKRAMEMALWVEEFNRNATEKPTEV